MEKKIWQPNETQTQFINILKEYPAGATLKDIALDKGVNFKTGSVNTLVSKGLVEVSDSEVKVNLVYRDQVIGTVTKNWKVYKLVSND